MLWSPDEFVGKLREDQVQYGGFVVYGVDERGNVTSRREKFITVSWVGGSVGVMAKARVTSQRGEIKGYFTGSHLDYQISDVDDLSEDDIVKKLLQSGGAHKPKYYDFGGADAGERARAGTLHAGDVGNEAEEVKETEVAKSMADEEQQRRVLEDKQSVIEQEDAQADAAATAKAAADAEQRRRLAEDAKKEEEAAAERAANQEKAAAEADAEKLRRESEPGPDDAQKTQRRKMSLDAAAEAICPTSPVKEAEAKEEAAAAAAPEDTAGKPTYNAVRKQWMIEKAGKGEPIYIKDTKMMQTVYISQCDGATIVVEGKVNGVCIDGCKKTQVVVETVISAVETVNCKSIKFQISGSCPSASIDKTDGCTIYLMSDEAKKIAISTSKHSDVQVAFMKGDDMVEVPVPEQFVHEIGEDKKLGSKVSELYSS